ncbi:hypothetical protein VU04_03395 [Desulfobulbus sp. TB]|nr:hypothetical protein [Desulfobulbus sp. TB]
MQKLQSEQRVRLVVRAYDRLSEVFLINSDFQRIAAGIGELEAVVSPGIYKARFRIGQKQVDQLVEVDRESPERATLEICGDPVDFSSPVPLAGAGISSGQQVHQQAAQELSCAVAEQRGQGSWLFVFIRQETEVTEETEGTETAEVRSAPWTGISLHDLDGTLVAEPNQGTCDQENGYFSLHIEVNPGTYRLRVEEEPGEFYEMFVQTEQGWQTQIFAVSEQAWLPDIAAYRAALSSAAVLMVAAGQGFSPDDTVARQVELLRLSLLHGRPILSQEIVQGLLAQEVVNPMEIFYAALQVQGQVQGRGSRDTDLLTMLLNKLPPTFAEHTDLQALKIPNQSAMRPIFSAPPMFRASWDRIAQAVDQRKVIVPPGSLAAQVADGLMNTSLWLIHRLNRMDRLEGEGRGI